MIGALKYVRPRILAAGAATINGPGRDWITDCGDQIVVYLLLIAAEAAISS